MEGEVGKRALECILMPAMFAAKNVRAQRDRLLQLRRRLQPHADAAAVQELAADLFKVYSMGLKHGAGYLTSCPQIAYDNDADISFCNPAFAFIPDEQLYAALFAHSLPPRPPGTRTEAFARIELAYHAVNLALGHHVPRCIEFLVGERPPDNCVVGYPDDTVAAATEHIFKTRLADMLPPDADDATKERIPRSRPRLFNRGLDLDPADDPAAAPTWKPPQVVASSNDPDQALSYLHRACSLAASPPSTSTSPSPSSPPSSTPRRSPKPPKWPTKTHTSLRKDPIHQINQLVFVTPDRESSHGKGMECHCTADRSQLAPVF